MRGRLLALAGIGAILAVGLVGCTGGDTVEPVSSATATPSSSASASAPAPTASASPSPTAATTATPGPAVVAAQQRFDAANQQVAAAGTPNDQSIIAGLTAAGFSQSAMQITPDATTIGRAVDSIQVSVLVRSTCLIGGFTGSTYTSDTAPVLSNGKCLLGNTSAIN